jgi:hypothetical protein
MLREDGRLRNDGSGRTNSWPSIDYIYLWKELSIHTIPLYWCTNIGISFAYWMPTRPQDTRIVRICVSIAFVQRLSFAAIQQCPSTQHALRTHHLGFPFRCSTCLSASQFQIPFIGAFMIPWPSFRAGELWAALLSCSQSSRMLFQHLNTITFLCQGPLGLRTSQCVLTIYLNPSNHSMSAMSFFYRSSQKSPLATETEGRLDTSLKRIASLGWISMGSAKWKGA